MRKRFVEIDLLRGLAIIGMVIFHAFFILDYYRVVDFYMYSGGWFVLARTVQFLFLGLVGVSMSLSYQRSKVGFLKRHWNRGLKVFFLGILISFVTLIVIPSEYVIFGILHHIGVSIIVMTLFVGRRYYSLGFAIIAVLIAAGLVDIYQGLAQEDELSDYSSNLTLTNIIFSRFTPLIICVLGFIIIMIMYGKSGGDIIT